MIDVGTRLGNKYFVVTRQERVAIGERFEVRTPQGAVRWAQWLFNEALSARQVTALQTELSAIPGIASVRAPDELVTSPAGLPAAVFHQPFPRPLQELIPGLVVAEQESRRLPSARILIAWCAGLAESLHALHNARIVHGALALRHLGVEGDGEGARILISGFGLEPARRIVAGGVRPTLRADLAAVVLILQGLFEQCGVKLGGTALVRWDVLRNCARAGDHVALTRGAALAQTLRELIREEEASLRARIAVPRTAPSSTAPDPAPVTREPGISSRRKLGMVAGGLAVLAAGAALSLRLEGRGAALLRGITTRSSLSSGRCGEEPMAPSVGVSLSASARSIGAVCQSDGTLHLTVLSDEVLSQAQRSARRGEAFRGAPSRVAAEVSEIAVLRDPAEPAVFWRRTSGAPFGAARLTTPAEPIPFAQGAWRAERFRGVWPLRMERDAIWLASNLLVAGVPRAVVLRLPTDNREPPTAFRLGDVVLLAAIAGPASTLLVQDGNALSAITVATHALQLLSDDAGATAATEDIAARSVPLDSLPRSEPWSVASRWVIAAPEGVAVPGGARHFAVTTGDDPLTPGCSPTRCAARGAVHALAFAERGAPSDTRLTARGLASALAIEADGTRRVVGIGATGDGTAVWSIDSNGAASEVALQAASAPAALLGCGDELWIAHAQPPPRLAASPLTCALLLRR